MESTLTLPRSSDGARTIVENTMANVQRLKKRADSVLEDVFRALFEEIDTDKIRREVAAMDGDVADRADQARALARRSAIRCAAAGAVTGLPGGLIAMGALGADLAYLIYQQFRLILGIATIYGHEPSGRERFSEALSCLAFSSGVGIGKQSLAAMLGSATIEGGIIAEKIGARFARERLARLIPFVGAVSGGALNYVSVHAVARSAIRYYENRVDPVVVKEILADGDREHA